MNDTGHVTDKFQSATTHYSWQIQRRMCVDIAWTLMTKLKILKNFNKRAQSKEKYKHTKTVGH